MESVRAHTPSVHKCPQIKRASNLQRESRLRSLTLIGAEHLPINLRDYLFHASHGAETRARQLMAHCAPGCPVSVRGNDAPVGLQVQNPESSEVTRADVPGAFLSPVRALVPAFIPLNRQ